MAWTQPLDLVDAAGAAVPAEVDVSKGADAVTVRIRWSGREVSATDADAFSALCTLRRELAREGLMPRCYGACRNLVVSAMAAQMAAGMAGYLVRLGQPARKADLVPIFDAGPDVDLASVAEQEAFKVAWLRSLGWRI